MGESRDRVLFIPVSGPRGMGEYARALALATAAAQRSPDLAVHFVVSREAPYAADVPFPATRLPASPTFHSREVAATIREFRPTLVVFDNAGRTAQLQAAARSGARVVFISSRRRQRRKAFRIRWMRSLDEHWIAYPSFVAGAIGRLERLKLRLLGRPVVRFLDALLPTENAQLAATVMERFGVKRDSYVLIAPGGGTAHPGAEDAPQIVADAAARIASHGCTTLLLGVQSRDASGWLQHVPRVPMAQLAELVRGAKLVVSNGGDTLLQVIACRRPCVAVPIAGDQAHRIRECVRMGLALEARLDADDIERVVMKLLDDESARMALTASAARGAVTNGMDIAVSAIVRLAAARTDALMRRS